MKKKLAVVTTHPIQYNAPLFRLLAERSNIAIKVFYTWGQTKSGQVYDPDFTKTFAWDIPLQEGYECEFVENLARRPGSGRFGGIVNKDLLPKIEHYQADALLVYGWSFRSHLQVLRAFKDKKKILFRGDSTLLDEPPGFSLKKSMRRAFLKWVYGHVDIALYAGGANRSYYLAHGLKERQLLHAPHAVENERFYDRDGQFERQAMSLRVDYGIPSGAVAFLFAGKLEPKKDPRILIDAAQRLEDPGWRLMIAGSGVLEAELKKRADHDERIVFLGFQNQRRMPIIYRLGDVFVLPSRGPGETWGLSVNEAMACSRPVIVSNRCGCAQDLVTDNGIRFEAGNEDELVSGLSYCLQNRDRLRPLGENSRRNIEEYSLERLASRIESAV